MSSNLKVNTILPSTGNTVAISGIASVTSSISIASSCTATTFYGDGSNLTGTSGVTINDNANNRIITGSGTANTLNANSNLTFSSGSGILSLTGDIHVSGEVAIAENIIHTGDGNTKFGFPANDTIAFTTAGGERLRITSTGEVNIGNGAGYSIWRTTGNDSRCKFQFKQTTGDNRGFALLEERGDANSIDFFLSKSRGGNGVGAVNSGDNLGFIKFSGGDGTRQHNGAGIQAWTSGTIATGRVPANLSFYTAPDSVSQFQERLRIDSGGRVTKPSQPMVGCRRFSQNGSTVYNDGSDVIAYTFHNIDVNVGSHFNNTTGIFTCPVDGNYFISCQSNLRATSNSWSSVYIIYKPSGGSAQKLSDNWATSTINNTWSPISASHLCNCNAGDELSMAYNSGYSAPSNSSTSGGVQMSIFLFG